MCFSERTLLSRLCGLSWSFFLFFALVGAQHRSSVAGDSAGPIASSSTVSPAVFQSPSANVQASANTAAAINNQAVPAVAVSPAAAGASQAKLLAKVKPLAPAASNSSFASRIAPSTNKQIVGSTSSTSQSVVTVLGSLGVVLGLFFVTVWLLRGIGSKAGQVLPAEVVEPLGRTVVAKGQQLQLVRFGTKLVLISHSSAGIKNISEITDPVEVDRIAGLCHGTGPLSSTRAFRSVLDGFAGRGASKRYDVAGRRPRDWRGDRVVPRSSSREDDDV